MPTDGRVGIAAAVVAGVERVGRVVLLQALAHEHEELVPLLEHDVLVRADDLAVVPGPPWRTLPGAGVDGFEQGGVVGDKCPSLGHFLGSPGGGLVGLVVHELRFGTLDSRCRYVGIVRHSLPVHAVVRLLTRE